jgi:hypothetical protein
MMHGGRPKTKPAIISAGDHHPTAAEALSLSRLGLATPANASASREGVVIEGFKTNPLRRLEAVFQRPTRPAPRS